MNTYIYGVYGMTEWRMLIPAGQARILVRFTGGSMSGYGAVPARFSTRSEYVRRLIEMTPEFRSGRIRRLSAE